MPTEDQDRRIDHSNLDVDYEYFEREIRPILTRRVPAFANLKLKNAWAAYNDYNTFDRNPIIGSHIIHENFFTAAGFSGHGIQHAPAIGKSLMEKFLDGAYIQMNLRKFGMTRIMKGNKLSDIEFI